MEKVRKSIELALVNMMIEVGFPNEVNKSIMRLLEYVTQKMSRGIPIGPHASHLLAEMSLIPIDESLTLKDIDYCRYADDIIVFANDEMDARAKTYSIASILDSNQRLMLQRQKTRLYSRDAFLEYARQMIADNPMDIQEEMLEIIRSYSSDNPYIAALAAMYPTASENIRRKIILCAYRNHAVPFIRELKEQYPVMSEWTKRAYLVACSILIPEERRFFLKNASTLLPADAILEKSIINWALSQ